ncbi:hypothetical protein D3C75_792020 [compost metagenome]
MQPAGNIADTHSLCLAQLDDFKPFRGHAYAVVRHREPRALAQPLHIDLHLAALRFLADAMADRILHQRLQQKRRHHTIRIRVNLNGHLEPRPEPQLLNGQISPDHLQLVLQGNPVLLEAVGEFGAQISGQLVDGFPELVRVLVAQPD